MKSRTFLAPFFISTCLISINASAACIVCWGGQCWSLANNSCNEVSDSLPTSGSTGFICFTLGPTAFKPNTDYILTEKGKAWLVQGPKKTPFGSDSMGSSFTRLNIKYPATKNDDPKINKESIAAWSAFFSKPDSGIVSPEVLSKFSKEMGLGVRQTETGSKK